MMSILGGPVQDSYTWYLAIGIPRGKISKLRDKYARAPIGRANMLECDSAIRSDDKCRWEECGLESGRQLAIKNKYGDIESVFREKISHLVKVEVFCNAVHFNQRV